MIRVDRLVVPAPQSLTAAGGRGLSELVAARDYYAVPRSAAYKFRAYKSVDVKAALHSLFHGKCAYCEAIYSATGPGDVEHFRPKGRVAGEDGSKGYWWLAMRWENLLPACIDCNRRRKQVIVTVGMSLEQALVLQLEGRGAFSGKHEAFPVGGIRAICEADDVTLEDPLLLDPTTSDPAEHLNFAINLPISLLLPNDSDRGKASIQTYGLNRLGLVQARTEMLMGMRKIHADIRRYIDRAEACQDAGDRSSWIDEAMKGIRALRAKTDSRQPFAAMARAFVASLEEDLQNLQI
jgi:hypothetical protein